MARFYEKSLWGRAEERESMNERGQWESAEERTRVSLFYVHVTTLTLRLLSLSICLGLLLCLLMCIVFRVEYTHPVPPSLSNWMICSTWMLFKKFHEVYWTILQLPTPAHRGSISHTTDLDNIHRQRYATWPFSFCRDFLAWEPTLASSILSSVPSS